MSFSLGSIGKKLHEYEGAVGRFFGGVADAVVPGDQSNWHRPAPPQQAPVQPVQRPQTQAPQHSAIPNFVAPLDSFAHFTVDKLKQGLHTDIPGLGVNADDIAKQVPKVIGDAGHKFAEFEKTNPNTKPILARDGKGGYVKDDQGRYVISKKAMQETIDNAGNFAGTGGAKFGKAAEDAAGKVTRAAGKSMKDVVDALGDAGPAAKPKVASKPVEKPNVSAKGPWGDLPPAADPTAKPKVAWQDRPAAPEISKKDPDFQEVLAGLSRGRGAGQVERDLVASQIRQEAKSLKVNIDHDFIHRYQTGTLATDAEKKLAETVKAVDDKIFANEKLIRPDIEYRQNHIKQSYSNFDKPHEKSGAVGFRTSTGSEKPRTFETYKEAADFGYTPKYDSLDKIMGAAAGSARSAVEHSKVITHGIDKGIFVPKAGEGRSPLTGFFSPGGDQLYAEKKLADTINGVMQHDTSSGAKLVNKAGTVSATAQDIGLQGGIPGTNANFFVAGQLAKDTTRNIGKAVTLRPIQAIKQETHLIHDFFRGKNNTQKRFAKNADFIREMADRGLNISHQSSLHGDGKNVVAKGWNSLGNNPTFGRYMPNRLLSTAQEVYQQSVNKLGHEGALDLAASTTKRFNGIVDEVAKGRSNLTQDAAKAVLFAPKYRESIINALTNVVRSVVDPRTYGDKAFNPSREMLAGMVTTLYAYNKLNEELNGHGMMDNPPGQETSLQIPYGEKDANGNQPVLRIPFMPGYMTIPRALWGAASGAMHGDVGEVVAQGGKMLSMPINTATAVIGNKDYFGRSIYNDQKTADAEGIEPDSALKTAEKVGGYIIGQNTPAWVRAGINAAQGKPTEQNIATALEAPVRFGKVTNPDTVAYFEAHERQYKALDKNERAAWDQLHPAKKDAAGEAIGEMEAIYKPVARLDVYNNYPKVFEADRAMDALSRSQGKPGNPMFDLTREQLKKVLEHDNLPPGAKDPELSNLYSKPWYADYAAKKTDYFTSVKKGLEDQLATVKKGKDNDIKTKKVAQLEASLGKFSSSDNPYPKPSDDLQKTMDYYNSLPKGTGARSSWIKANPAAWGAMTNQFAAIDNWQNKQRTKRGLDETEGETGIANGYSSGSSYKKGSGGGNGPDPNPSKYAVSLNAGGTMKRGKVTIKGSAPRTVKRASQTKPKVSLKKSLV